MATKTISITEEAYNNLVRHRRENDSFSIIINRELGCRKAKLSDFFGILSKEDGEKLEKNIKKIRELRKKVDAKRAEKLKEMFK